MSTPALAPVCLLLGFIATLGAYLALTLTGHDANELVPTVATLLGLVGLTGHIEKRTQQQNAVIAKIDKQTNGVLDGRIQDGTKTAIQSLIADGTLVTVTPVVAPAARPGRKPAAKRTAAK